jgi:signal transduction histidine kinase
MFELVLIQQDGPSRRFRLTEKGLVIGRSPEVGVRVNDELVSRQHARVFLAGDEVRVKDLDSRNGIFVNGHRVTEGVLKEGDTMNVGNIAFQLSRYAQAPATNQTMISFEQGAQLCEEFTTEMSAARLPVLYRAARLLDSVFDLDELLDKILGLLFEALPIRRAFVLTLDGGDQTPVVRASRSKETGNEGPPLSHTLIEHVMHERTAVHTVDAQEDSRFDGALSIMGHQIHAAMCAPLVGRAAATGALYADSGKSNAPFSENDFQLFTAIAHVVGVAVENSRLHSDMLEQERLAAIGEATAGLGHCMKNILTGIKGGAEYVDTAIRKEDIEYVKKAWPIMSRAIARIEMLVVNLLTYSRERKPERMTINLNDLMRDVLEAVRSRADKCGVKLSLEEDPGTVADVDAQQIYRVVLNLVTNAIDACENADGGDVGIATRNASGGCYIEVRDTGPGIPLEVRDRLGKAFVSSKGSAGTGLGLAVSYKLVREHGGDIQVESTSEKGTLFSIFLPRSAEDSGIPRPTNIRRL